MYAENDKGRYTVQRERRLEIRRDTRRLLLPHQGLTIQLLSIYSILPGTPIALRDQNRHLNSLTFFLGISHARVTRSVISYASATLFAALEFRERTIADRGRSDRRYSRAPKRSRPIHITSSATGLPPPLSPQGLRARENRVI